MYLTVVVIFIILTTHNTDGIYTMYIFKKQHQIYWFYHIIQ